MKIFTKNHRLLKKVVMGFAFYRILCYSLSILLLFFVFPLFPRVKYYRAKAYNPGTKLYLFTAVYKEKWKKKKHISTVITYKKHKQKSIFSTKKLDFTKSFTVPDLTYRETKGSYFQMAKKKTDRLIELFIEEKPKRRKKRTNLTVYPNSVLDEGSHYFIKQNWSKLLQGKTLSFRFIAPDKRTDYAFFVKKEKSDKKTVTFILKASGLITRFFAIPTSVTYDRKKKRIMIYQGITNIREKGKGVYAYMVFSY